MRLRDVTHERIEILHDAREARRVAAIAGRLAVAARVPREERRVVDAEVLHDVDEAAAVLVAAMHEDHRLLRALEPTRDRRATRPCRREPGALALRSFQSFHCCLEPRGDALRAVLVRDDVRESQRRADAQRELARPRHPRALRPRAIRAIEVARHDRDVRPRGEKSRRRL